MKCWIPGGVVLKNGKRINYRDTLGHWQRKAVGEDRVIWQKGDKVYTGDWIPHTSWVGKLSLAYFARASLCAKYI